MHRVVCFIRGRHRWVTRHDAAGHLTSCARCGVLRHVRLESVAHGSFKVHTNVAAEFSPLPSHGPEELNADESDVTDM